MNIADSVHTARTLMGTAISAWSVGTWMKMLFLAVLVYLAIGAAIVIWNAFLSAASGREWFAGNNRWNYSSSDDLANPIGWIFAWPLLTIFAVVVFLVGGVISLIEYLGDRARAAGTAHEQRARNAAGKVP